MTPRPPADNTDALIEEARALAFNFTKVLEGVAAYGMGFLYKLETPERVASILPRLADALAREREDRKEAEAHWQEADHPFDASEFKALLQRAERAEAQTEALRESWGILRGFTRSVDFEEFSSPAMRERIRLAVATGREALASLPSPQGEQ